MKASLQQICTCFIENRDLLRSNYRLENSYILPIAAAIFADKGRIVQPERLKQCERMLKEKTGMLSSFRGLIKLPAISLMAVSDDPEQLLQKALQAYAFLKENFWESNYLPLAALTTAGLTEEERMAEVAVRTRRIYDRIKKEHPLLTSSEDSAFVAMLALSEKNDDQLLEETESCYRLLKPFFVRGNAVQSLSHLLVLGEGTSESKCNKVIALYETLKENRMRYGKEYELATLGVLALLPVSIDVLVREMSEVDLYLLGQHGYGIFGLGRRQRLMHAAMLISSDYIGQSEAMYASAISSTMSMMIAQQAAICCSVASVNAAASSRR